MNKMTQKHIMLRGWTLTILKKYLGDPPVVKQAQYSMDPSVYLWDTVDVLAAEKHPEFVAWRTDIEEKRRNKSLAKSKKDAPKSIRSKKPSKNPYHTLKRDVAGIGATEMAKDFDRGMASFIKNLNKYEVDEWIRIANLRLAEVRNIEPNDEDLVINTIDYFVYAGLTYYDMLANAGVGLGKFEGYILVKNRLLDEIAEAHTKLADEALLHKE